MAARPLPDFLAVDWIGTVVPFFGRAPYPAAVETLRRLRAQGATLVVVSSARQQLLDGDVARVGVAADEVIGCDKKALVFSDLRVRYGNGLAVGDHPSDLAAAREAGLDFLQAAFEGQPAMDGRAGAFVDWSELPALLGSA